MTDTNSETLTIHLAHTQGFCAGVAMAIETVDLALEKFGAPLYVRHHIVHNNAVIQDFEKKGVVFVEDLDAVPSGQPVVFSAHGTAPEIYEEAKKRDIKIVDATCPLVTKVHREALRFSKKNIHTILIGHRGHQELIGTSGYVSPELLYVIEDEGDIDALTIPDGVEVGFLTQTTLSVSDTAGMIAKLKAKFPGIHGPTRASDICYATTNRQDTVVELTEYCDLILICGSSHSSNSNRLRETAEAHGVPAYLLDFPEDLDIDLVKGKYNVGISSGASVPRYVVDQLVERIKAVYPDADVIEKESIEKGIEFPIPAM